MKQGKITVGIIDDEPNGRAYIELLLSNEFPDLELTFVGESVTDAVRLLYQYQVDILLLDVQLQDGNIFNLFDKIDVAQLRSQIVFITAYEQYALPAIKAQATDYLLKPVSPMDFSIALNRSIKRLKDPLTPVSPIVADTEGNIDQDNFLIVPTTNGFLRVPQKDIIFCEADSNYTKIVRLNNQTLLASKNLKEYERILCHKNFFRIHHKYLINTNFISEYIRGKGGQVVLNNQYILDVSIRKKADLMDYLQISTN